MSKNDVSGLLDIQIDIRVSRVFSQRNLEKDHADSGSGSIELEVALSLPPPPTYFFLMLSMFIHRLQAESRYNGTDTATQLPISPIRILEGITIDNFALHNIPKCVKSIVRITSHNIGSKYI